MTTGTCVSPSVCLIFPKVCFPSIMGMLMSIMTRQGRLPLLPACCSQVKASHPSLACIRPGKQGAALQWLRRWVPGHQGHHLRKGWFGTAVAA
jgi:hypothetical protein